MGVYEIKIVRTKDVGTQIFVDGKYLTTYMGHNDTLAYQLENSNKTDIECVLEIASEREKTNELLPRVSNSVCSHVHDIMKMLLGYNYCPVCGEKCEIKQTDC